jgi:hypothetical protein
LSFKEQTVTFSAKLHPVQGTEEAANLREDEPFPFFYDGRRVGKGTNTPLDVFPLAEGDMLSVETNISAFDILAKDGSTRNRGFSFSLRDDIVAEMSRRSK